ncbi:hypothetical protein GCM10020369_08350 [Cryptosporangium minutisporangium]|uniref:Uncharacterized protein n=1 Tax=Cryptosporangium minutisporangium TaxID=113569 RepID=A0ABP6SRW2_9ACTN
MRAAHPGVDFISLTGSSGVTGTVIAAAAASLTLKWLSAVGGQAVVGLVPADPVAQRLRMHPELFGESPDHRLRVCLPIQPDRTGPQLIGALLRCRHRCFVPAVI